MNDSIRRGVAAAAVATAVVHLALVGEYLDEAAYLGVLFVAGSAALGWAAARLWRRDDAAAWTVATVVSVGMMGGFALSRTIGLPGFQESEWEAAGVASMLLEAAVVAGAWMRHSSSRTPASRRVAASER